LTGVEFWTPKPVTDGPQLVSGVLWSRDRHRHREHRWVLSRGHIDWQIAICGRRALPVPHGNCRTRSNMWRNEVDSGAAFEEPRYRTVGLDTLDFLLKGMTTAEKGSEQASTLTPHGTREGRIRGLQASCAPSSTKQTVERLLTCSEDRHADRSFLALLTFEWVPNRPHDATRSDRELLSLASWCPLVSRAANRGGAGGGCAGPRAATPMSPTERRP
jgi:hypothetical protein